MVDANFIKDGVESLIPPGSRPRSEAGRWEVSVSAALLGVIIVGGTHILWACGFLAWMGLPGFANAADFSNQQTALVSIQQSLKQADIDRDLRQVCVARQANNQSALTAWSISLQRDVGAFLSITQNRQQPIMRACDELIITAAVGSNG